VHFIDDVHFVFAGLRGKPDLFYQAADIVDRVIAGGVELVYIQRSAFVEGHAGTAFVAGFSIGQAVFAIDGFGQYPGAGGFAHTPGAAEQKSMRKLFVFYRILQCCGDMALPYYRIEGLRTILSGRNNEFLHACNLRKVSRKDSKENNAGAQREEAAGEQWMTRRYNFFAPWRILGAFA